MFLLPLAAGAVAPLVLSRSRTNSFLSDKSARDVAFYSAIGAGALALVTGSSTLGAVAIGSAGAWTLMKGDDVARTLP